MKGRIVNEETQRENRCFGCDRGTKKHLGGPYTAYSYTGSRQVTTLTECDTCGRVELDETYYPQGDAGFTSQTWHVLHESDRGQSLGPGPQYGADPVWQQPLIDVVVRLGNLYCMRSVGDVPGRDPVEIRATLEKVMDRILNAVEPSIAKNPSWDQLLTLEKPA